MRKKAELCFKQLKHNSASDITYRAFPACKMLDALNFSFSTGTQE